MRGSSSRVSEPFFSVGHGTIAAQEFLERLATGGVRQVVDIRRWPQSKRHPQFSREPLTSWLVGAGISYRWEPRLGGYRKPPPDSPDRVWRNENFRGYAAHLRTREAVEGLVELIRDADEAPTAYMCSETLWWRCHRRLVSDALVLLYERDVRHLLPTGFEAHRPTDGARVVGGQLFYDGGSQELT